MPDSTPHISTDNGHNPRYQHRLELVIAVIRHHTDLTDQQARDLARHVLHTLDHIPEQIR